MDSASLGKELETEEECASEIDDFGRTFMARRLSQTMGCWDREGRLGAALLHNPQLTGSEHPNVFSTSIQ